MNIIKDEQNIPKPNNTPVLAMYDVRGIQEYIFRTPEIEDAMGASSIVETVIEEALHDAVDSVIKEENEKENGSNIRVQLEWCTEDGPIPYNADDEADIQVLYIGGGNAYVIFSDRELCIRINKKMSKYIIEHTYSLQLAAAFVEKGNDYKTDYSALINQMNAVKANMIMSKPIAAFPMVQVEEATGYAISGTDGNCSIETMLKRLRKTEISEDDGLARLRAKRGKNNTIAVVHIDGNNMALRIKGLIENQKTYDRAVNMMRDISYNIDSSYKKCFEEVKKEVESSGYVDRYTKKHVPYNTIYKIVTAGDDITYISNGKIALASVEAFAKKISAHTMIPKEKLTNYGIPKEGSEALKFSVCAGIAYISPKFGFAEAYEIAENCCESAKDKAKKEKDGDKIGNWVDFQIVKSIHAKNLSSFRKQDYVTNTGETLLKRPYFIPVEKYPKDSKFYKLATSAVSYPKLVSGIEFFKWQRRGLSNQSITMSDIEKLKYAYTAGELEVKEVQSQLVAKKCKMPDTTVYDEEKGSIPVPMNDKYDMYARKYGKVIAKWYDVLEMIDLYEKIK